MTFDIERYNHVSGCFPTVIVWPYLRIFSESSINERVHAFSTCLKSYMNFIYSVLATNFLAAFPDWCPIEITLSE